MVILRLILNLFFPVKCWPKCKKKPEAIKEDEDEMVDSINNDEYTQSDINLFQRDGDKE